MGGISIDLGPFCDENGLSATRSMRNFQRSGFFFSRSRLMIDVQGLPCTHSIGWQNKFEFLKIAKFIKEHLKFIDHTIFQIRKIIDLWPISKFLHTIECDTCGRPTKLKQRLKIIIILN